MFWTTRGGKTIAMSEMSDIHLTNSIAYMRRRIASMKQSERSMWGCYTMINGEQAQYAAEQCLDQAAEDIDDAVYRLRCLDEEKSRRQ